MFTDWIVRGSKATRHHGGVWLAFARDGHGATAVEFALVAPILLPTILFLMSVGYMLMMGQMLDFATQKAARQLRTGAVQTAQMTQSTFRTQVVCAQLPSMFNCNNVIVNLQPVQYGTNHPYEYYPFVNSAQTAIIIPPLDNSKTSYCPGQAKGYVYLQILYPVNFFMSLLSTSTFATTYQGQSVYLIMATATFLNEPFNAPASAC